MCTIICVACIIVNYIDYIGSVQSQDYSLDPTTVRTILLQGINAVLFRQDLDFGVYGLSLNALRTLVFAQPHGYVPVSYSY